MTYTYLFAGENLELAEAELKGFLRSQKKEEKISRDGRLAETPEEPMQLKRLGLTQEVSEKICEIQDVEKFSRTEFEVTESYAVRVENLTEQEKDTKKLEKRIGSELETEKNSVDLENPETVIKAYILEEKIVIGELVEEINRGLFEKRKNQNRPFSSPVSLDPVLARVLVNLSGVKPGEHVLDPFCGTGGILIEAGLCGVGVHGLDVKEEMKEGAEKNLEEYGVISHDVRQGEISKAQEIFGDGFDAVVTDLPYGKSSKKVGKPVEEFLKFIEEVEAPVVFMYDEEELGGYTSDFSVYIHKNLTRHIFVV
jgi:tRNA (guanine10-N2)-dimethyltransferase